MCRGALVRGGSWSGNSLTAPLVRYQSILLRRSCGQGDDQDATTMQLASGGVGDEFVRGGGEEGSECSFELK
jgi:hypothetical protein